MKIINSIIKIIDKLINFITTIFFILVILIGLYAIYDSYYMKDQAKLSDDILSLRPDEQDDDFSLAYLQDINSDICAWIRIDDTNIDYPVVIGKDNSEYLSIDYKKEFSTLGSIFLDYRNNRAFTDDYSIIYGHNMRGDLMFADIKKFNDATFFNSHTSGKLYTTSGLYKIEIFCIVKVNAFSNDIYSLNIYRNGYNSTLIDILNKSATYKRDINVTGKDKLLLLSTCAEAGSNNRFVLVARLKKVEKTDSAEVINDESRLRRLEEEKQEPKNISENNVTENVEQKVVKVRKHISVRNWLLIILSIIVIIIFIILIIKKIKLRKSNVKVERITEEKNKKKKKRKRGYKGKRYK